jgi:hypothetical protein
MHYWSQICAVHSADEMPVNFEPDDFRTKMSASVHGSFLSVASTMRPLALTPDESHRYL